MKNQELGKTYKDGEIICREGEEGKNMYIVQSGKVKVSRNLPHGVLPLTTLKPGDVFGEMALFDHKVRSATVEAVGEAVVLGIDKKRFFAKASKDPTLVFNILERLSNRVRTLNDTLSRLKESRNDMLGSFSDIDEICRQILKEARSSIKADNGSVMLLDKNIKALSISAAFGSKADLKAELKEGKGIAGNVLTTGNIELVNNISADPRFIPGQIEFENLLCAPIKGKDGVVGVVNLSRNYGNPFNSDEAKMLKAISGYASIAIENTKLFSEIGDILDNIRPGVV